jgi:hypothetical protein
MYWFVFQRPSKLNLKQQIKIQGGTCVFDVLTNTLASKIFAWQKSAWSKTVRASTWIVFTKKDIKGPYQHNKNAGGSQTDQSWIKLNKEGTWTYARQNASAANIA